MELSVLTLNHESEAENFFLKERPWSEMTS